MGKLINGINGPFLGKVGPSIGSSWKGIPYIKGPYKKRTGRASREEKGNRNKFAMAQRWLQPALPFVRQGFKNYSPTVDGFLAAKSWLLLHSFEGIQPDISINPALVKLSHGSLPLPANIRVEKINGSQLQFSWDPARIEDSHPRDQVMLMAYDIDHGQVSTVIPGQFRETGADSMQLSPQKKRTYHIYLAFVAQDRSRQSDSVYLGAIVTG
jgi:hypothetical protein